MFFRGKPLLGIAVTLIAWWVISRWFRNRDRAGGSRSPLHDPTKGVFV